MLNREEVYSFLNTTPGEASPTWKLFGDRIEDQSFDWNTQTQTRQFITKANATTTSTSFQRQTSVTQYADPDDATFEFIDDIFFHEKRGVDAQTDLLEVFPYRTDGSPFDAKKTRVLVVQSSNGGPGGDNYQYAYELHVIDEPVFGTVVITNGVPVFTEAA